MGLITSIGNDRSSVVENLRLMRHGIECPLMLQGDDSPVKVAGTVKEFEVDSSDPEDWVYPNKYRVSRAILAVFHPMSSMHGVLCSKRLKMPIYQRKTYKTLALVFTHHQGDRCVQFINILKKWIVEG